MSEPTRARPAATRTQIAAVVAVAAAIYTIVIAVVWQQSAPAAHGPTAIPVTYTGWDSGDDSAYFIVAVPDHPGGPARVAAPDPASIPDAEANSAVAAGAAAAATIAGHAPAAEMVVGAVDGPSIGLIAAIAELDRATPGKLAGELRVAATGTINSYGRVGAVGRVAEKQHAALAARADVFYIPVANAFETVTVPGGADVVAVSTLGDVLLDLCARRGQQAACDAITAAGTHTTAG